MAKKKKRDIYKYEFKIGNKIVYGGISRDLERREQEHKRTYGEKGHIKQVGRRTTEEAARKWEIERPRSLPNARVNVPMPSVKHSKPSSKLSGNRKN